MAAVFYRKSCALNSRCCKQSANSFPEAIEAAAAKGWITEPEDTGISDVVVAGTTCDKIEGAAIGPYTITDYGTGWVKNSPQGTFTSYERILGAAK